MKREQKTFPILYPNAAGIDISSKEHFVAVNSSKTEQAIRSFGCYTEDLHRIVAWLKSCEVDTVAMEATGIYWVSLYQLLEESGFEVFLVNARHVKNVRGKKSDVSDAEWIRQLHSCGLLTHSFQPDNFTRTLRCYMRHRKNLLEMASTHIRMMHKALEQMNIKVQHVLSDITGVSGQAVIKAILSGERDAAKLASYCNKRIRGSKLPEIKKSLVGNWRSEHLFELSQSYELYQYYHQKIAACDKEIAQHVRKHLSLPEASSHTSERTSKTNKNNLNFDAKSLLEELTQTDVSEIFGITDTNGLEIISEIGLDMSKFPTAKHFTSWLNLAPNTKVSGGKVLSSRIPCKKNRAGQIFKMAAFAVQRSKNWLGAFYHRIKAKSGAPKAIVATARKIATIFYTMLKEKTKFNPIPIDDYIDGFKELEIKRLKRKAKLLGYQIITE